MTSSASCSARTPLPPLLEPYLAYPPQNSLVLLTNVLGASSNWLVLRWVYALLGGRTSHVGDALGAHANADAHADADADELARAETTALNLLNNNKFIFVDGLTALCLPDTQLPAGSPAARDHLLRGTAVENVRKGLEDAIAEASARASEGRVVLVLDQMDAWLALGEAGAVEVMDMLLGLREKVHATILTVSADDPLLHAQTTTLEKEHAAFALSLAHEAYRVMALRLLDTGTARDVSGVMRITGGGKGNGGTADAEYLYYVSGDGGVRVFERGT
ncbi:hypothetical protein E4U21_007734 [Claviceps maximensis]|nr:hypothetical protein E4U21_007734 [Claviceps maximensis]